MKKTILSGVLCISMISAAYADGSNSLILSDAEIQKLKSHFQPDEIQSSIWKGDPINIQLPIGKEKRIEFPDNVVFDIKGALTTDQLKVVNNDKSVYLTVLNEFDKTRVYATCQSTGKVILIDLIPSDDASVETLKIRFPVEYKQNREDETNLNTINNDLSDATNGNVSYMTLLRYVWQQVYAPETQRESENVYSRSPMHTEPFISYLVYGDKVIIHPIGSWTAGGNYVTAISLQNKYNHATNIDITRDICGKWEAALVYPRAHIQPDGKKSSDNTTLFLVSKRPFGETTGVCHGDA